MDPSTVGLIAGFLTTLSFVPQVLKIWRSKSAEDLSLPTFAAFTVGVLLWLWYGVLVGEIAIILWNGVTVILSGAILAMKLRYG